MKKIKSIIAFGCSHTAGCELANIKMSDYFQNHNSISINDDITKKYAYPNKLAQMLNVPCYNYAMSAGSNDRSLRLLPKAILSHPQSLVLFGWTNPFRKEFFVPESNFFAQDSDNFIQVGIHLYDLPSYYKNLLYKNNKVHPINKIFVEKIAYPYNNLNNNSFYVESICKLYAENYYHLLFFPEDKLPTDLRNKFDFEGDNNFLDWCQSRKFNYFEGNHFEEKAHTELANLLYEDLKSKY
jgi:lysophospholipase L1-like esterase